MSTLSNWFKDFFHRKKEGNVFSIDFKDKVEEAFTSNGITYYRFKSETTMPYGRYKFLETFIKQVDLRLTGKGLSAYLDRMESYINGEKGTVNLTKVIETILNIRSRLALTFEWETTYDYASAVYFDQNENLYEYDVQYNKLKKQRWREANATDFFYTRPMSELFGLSSLSRTDLEDYIRAQQEILANQTSDMPQL